jgi:cell division protein FtsI/penicillin-binding protein 2
VDAEFVSKNQLSQLPGVFVEPVESEGKLMLKVKYRPGVVDASTRTSTCRRLAEIFDLEADEVIDRCSKVAARCREVVIQRRASKEDAERMYAELKRNQINAGIRLEDSWIRTYPKDSVLANMLGYLDDRRSGVSGIESLMNGYLAPVDGKVKLRLDRRRRPVDGEVKVVEEAHDGADVYLTIEEPLQQIVEEELAELCRNFDPVRAYAIEGLSEFSK